jgi:hypothetical protein
LDSMIVLATRLAYFSSFSCATGSPLFNDRPARGDPIEKGVEGLDFGGFGADSAVEETADR